MVSLTEAAANQIKELLQARGKGLGIRIGTRKTGCSGLAYKMEYVDHLSEDLIDYTDNAVHVYVAKTDAHLLQDITVDYVRKGLNVGFEFINPLETGRCGCGESFRV